MVGFGDLVRLGWRFGWVLIFGRIADFVGLGWTFGWVRDLVGLDWGGLEMRLDFAEMGRQFVGFG